MQELLLVCCARAGGGWATKHESRSEARRQYGLWKSSSPGGQTQQSLCRPIERTLAPLSKSRHTQGTRQGALRSGLLGSIPIATHSLRPAESLRATD